MDRVCGGNPLPLPSYTHPLLMSDPLTESEIDRCLLSLYRHGSNYKETAAYLRTTALADRAPNAERLKRWRTSTYRDRYLKIAEDNAEDLEKEIIVRLRELVTQTGLMQIEALEVLMRQINAGDVKPSMLRELSVVSGVTIDKMMTMMGKPTKIVQVNNPDDIIKRLVEAGYAEVVEGTAEEYKELSDGRS